MRRLGRLAQALPIRSASHRKREDVMQPGFFPRVVSLALVGAWLAANACGVAWAQQPQQGGTLNVAFASDTKTLDPVYSINFSERQPLYLLYNTLVALKPDFSV